MKWSHQILSNWYTKYNVKVFRFCAIALWPQLQLHQLYFFFTIFLTTSTIFIKLKPLYFDNFVILYNNYIIKYIILFIFYLYLSLLLSEYSILLLKRVVTWLFKKTVVIKGYYSSNYDLKL